MNIGKSQITQLSNVINLGIIFDLFLNFGDHITAICRSTHFYIKIFKRVGICLRIMLILLIFMTY